MAVTYMVGDVRERMAEIADGSVSLIASSPPFLALRSYLPSDHASKGAEIGSEANPAAFIDTLLALTAEWGRVLAPWGSIAIELGDSYSGSVGAMYDTRPEKAGVLLDRVDHLDRANKRSGAGWPAAKSLALIPQLYAVALAYGINPLTGAPSPAGRWLVRNVIVWHRPNPAVGALGDKFRPSTSYIVVATRSPKRWFDLDAVRTPSVRGPMPNEINGTGIKPNTGSRGDDCKPLAKPEWNGSPPLDAWFDQHDTWTITTQPSRLAHYAMWPPKLAERLILSMCPEWVCAVCGEPRRRITGKSTLDTYRSSQRPQTKRAVALADQHGLTDEHIAAVRAFGTSDVGQAAQINTGAGKNTQAVQTLAAEAKAVLGGYFREFVMSTNSTPASTWSDCGHDAYTPGVVLDPFAGSGTTLAVAHLHGRDAIGMDLDLRNRDLYPRRLEECKRALFGTTPEMPGQLGMFDGEGAA